MGTPSTDINRYADLPKSEEAAAPAESPPKQEHAEALAKEDLINVAVAAAKLYAPTPLKVSDLLKLCVDVLTAQGDILTSVCVFNDTDNSHSIDPIVGHYFQVNEKDEAELLVLCDATHLQFAQENNDLEHIEIKPKGSV